MTKVVLFDFDGTIADSFDNFLGIIDVLAERHGFRKLSSGEIEELRLEDARTVMKKLHIPFYKIPFIAKDMKQMQQEKIASISPFSGLPEVLRQLAGRGYILGIITSNGKENVEAFLKKNKLSIFSYIHCDSSLFGKDRVIKNFLKQNNVSREDVLYVGDEARDIQACQKAGVKIAAVTWGFNSKEGLRKFHPDYLIGTPRDLLKLLLNI